ncbi:MAG: DUF6603 domain-containing protein [Solirubrobacteraceae bacterium]
MPSLATALREELARLVEPLVLAAQVDDGWPMVLRLVGHTADAADDPGLAAALTDLSAAASAVAALDDAELDSWSGVQAVVEASAKATTALTALQSAVSDPDLAARLEGLGEELTAQLAGVYLRRYRSRLFRAAAILTLVDPAEAHAPQPPVIDGATLARGSWSPDALHFDRIGPLLHRPWTTLSAAYFPNDLATAADAHAAAGLLFPLIGDALNELRLPWSLEQRSLAPPVPDPPAGTGDDGDHFGTPEPADPPDPPPPADPGDRPAFWRTNVPRLEVRIPQLQADGALAGTFLGIAVEAQSLEHPDGVAGLVVALTGALDWTQTREGWTLTAASQGDVPAFVVGPHGMALAPAATGADAHVSLTAVRPPPSGGGPAFVFGPTDGTRVELGAVRAAVDLALSASAIDAALTVAASSGKLVIARGDADGFLARVLPDGGISAAFDAGLIVSASRGVELTGGAGLETSRPLHLSLGSFGSVDAIVAAVTFDDAGLHARAGAALTLRLGPLAVSVDHVGVSATTTFPSSGGNLGPADLDIGFAGPSGLGLSLALGIVTGSGALVVDPGQGRYLGELGLSVGDAFDVKLLGLLVTHGAGGGQGFSLVIMGLATFPGIPLGFGFELNRAGAVVAVNRRLDTDAVTEAVAAGRLETLLAPGSDIAAAVGGLERILPAADGVYVGGLVIGLTWGEPVLARILLAFLYDTSSPQQLTLVGTVSVLLPEQSPLLKLHVDIVGRFDADPFAIDVRAGLRDSELAGLVLTGDAALQLQTGDDARFLLALGGFHPAFTPPAGFPTLRRLSLALPSNPLIQLSLTGYFAVTANTLQFGASLHFWAGIDGVLGVAGDASFDALVSWDPVRFEAALKVDVHVQVAGHNLFGAQLRGSLSGPGRWHVEGGVYIEVMWWEVKVYEVDTSFGSAPELPPPATVDPAAIVADALRAASSWSAAAPPTGVRVSAAASTGGGLLVSPAAALRVVQDRVPLGLLIDRVGTAPAGGARMVTLGAATVDGKAAGTTPVAEAFAPAQFLDLSEDEALARASFERMPAGLDLAPADAADPVGFARVADAGFETIPAPPQPVSPTDATVLAWQELATVATRAWEGPAQPVAMQAPTFEISSTQTLARDDAVTPVDGFASRTLALQALRRTGAPDLQVTEVA